MLDAVSDLARMESFRAGIESPLVGEIGQDLEQLGDALLFPQGGTPLRGPTG